MVRDEGRLSGRSPSFTWFRGADVGCRRVWQRGLSICCCARLLRVRGKQRNIVQPPPRCCFLGLFCRTRWALGLNRRTSQRPRQRYRHAKRSNRLQISPHIRIFPFGPYPPCFSGDSCRILKAWIVRTGVWMHASGRKLVSVNPDCKSQLITFCRWRACLLCK